MTNFVYLTNRFITVLQPGSWLLTVQTHERDYAR
jgi:hypothetical protein